MRLRTALIIPIAVCLVALTRNRRFIVWMNRLILGSSSEIPYDSPSVFRGLLPFGDSEPPPNRNSDFIACWRWITDSQFFILEGESGCGKTSLLNGYVIPECKKVGRTKILPPNQWHTVESLLDQLADSTFVVMDQFEDVFTIHRETIRKRAIRAILNAIRSNPRLKVIIGIRSDYRDLLDRLVREVEPGQEYLLLSNYFSLRPFLEAESIAATMAILSPLHANNEQLAVLHRDFSEELTRQLLERPRDKRLSQDDDPTVLPASLQLIGTTLEMTSGALGFNRSYLRQLGGKSGILKLFVDDVKRRIFRVTGVNESTTFALLTELSSETNLSQGRSLNDLALSIKQSPKTTLDILLALKRMRLVVDLPKRTTSDSPAFRLVHEHFVRVLDEAPDRNLQAARDAKERLRFGPTVSLLLRVRISGVIQ